MNHYDQTSPHFRPPRHPKNSNFAAGDLIHKEDLTRVVQIDFILGFINWDDSVDMFISGVDIKRYRGFIMVNMRDISKEHYKCFSWIYRKYDVYLVGVDDGYCLYKLGKGLKVIKKIIGLKGLN